MKNTLFIALLMLSQSVLAEWVLDNKASTLDFTTTKNVSKTEVQSFNSMQGQIKGNKATITVDLSSVDTGIEIRDQRIQELLFKVVKFPSATATINIKESDVKLMKTGQVKNMQVDAVIDLHGVKQTAPVRVQIVALAKNSRLVISTHPVIINLTNYNLIKGVNALRDIAKLKSINAAVPVTFSLLFTQK
ncbi:YceI family protein [Methyloprofundus sp.]|uniref:YceI family protein n=1 Tax=Methyloprofundus sp. TaxID=2020875 RepID=UPI003D0D26E5